MERAADMGIGKGVDWGGQGPLPEDGVVVDDDAKARHVVERARRLGSAVPVLGLLGGDLCRTLGGTGDPDRLRSQQAARVTVDVGCALLGGERHWFVAHLVARRSWWRGRTVVVANAQYLGEWDVGPRSHPGDGRFDVTDGDLPLADRWKALRRLPAGMHLPHPALRTAQVRTWQADLDPELDVYLDNELVGRFGHVEVVVEPEALTVVV